MRFYHREYQAFRALGHDDDTFTVLRRLVSLVARADNEESAASDYEAELNDLVRGQGDLPSR